jgi:hypothetical protein
MKNARKKNQKGQGLALKKSLKAFFKRKPGG